MQFEVEQKFHLADAGPIEDWMTAHRFALNEPITQIDRYFAHPQRDFAVTDEALRLRRSGEENVITYKGPKIDTETKTRRELELPIATGKTGLEDFSELLVALGFKRVAEVCKERRTAKITTQGTELELCFDDVSGVGKFIELEIVAEESELEAAKAVIAELAKELKLSKPERRSYLEMLLNGV